MVTLTLLLTVIFLSVVVLASSEQELEKAEETELDKLVDNVSSSESKKESAPKSEKLIKRGCFTWSRYKSAKCRNMKRKYITLAKVSGFSDSTTAD